MSQDQHGTLPIPIEVLEAWHDRILNRRVIAGDYWFTERQARAVIAAEREHQITQDPVERAGAATQASTRGARRRIRRKARKGAKRWR